MRIICAVFSHPRLQFKNSEPVVLDFIEKRLKSQGLETVRFYPNRAEALAQREQIKSQADYVVWIDAMNPLVDVELVKAMVDLLERAGAAECLPDGGIPGTEPEFVTRSKPANPRSVRLRWSTQEKHNNQFNLYKYKRLKMFLGLYRKAPRISSLSIGDFCELLESKEIYRSLISYFEEGDLIEFKQCPHCQAALRPLTLAMSQPFVGYLPAKKAYYHECEKCGLIVLSPALADEHVHRLYDEFDKQDFVLSPNNPYTAGSPRCDFSHFEKLLPAEARCIDLGGGIGRFSQYLKASHPNWQVTHSDFELKKNEHLQSEGITSRAIDFIQEDIGAGQYDLVTAWEVVEHVPFRKLERMFGNIHKALRPGGIFTFSTPDFDSPLCQAFDFFAAGPPFHLTVLGKKWLLDYFGKSSHWRIAHTHVNSDVLDDALMWYDYTQKTSPSFQLRGLSGVLKALYGSPLAESLKKELLSRQIGTEVILTLQKK